MSKILRITARCRHTIFDLRSFRIESRIIPTLQILARTRWAGSCGTWRGGGGGGSGGSSGSSGGRGRCGRGASTHARPHVVELGARIVEVIEGLVKVLILADGRRDKRTRANVVGREIPIHGSTEIVFYYVLCFFLHDVDGVKRYQFLLSRI